VSKSWDNFHFWVNYNFKVCRWPTCSFEN